MVIQATGTINNNYTMKLTVYEDTYSIDDNTSTCSWKLELTSKNYWNFKGVYSTIKLNVDGEVYNDYSARTIGQNTTTTITTGHKTITHNSDGTKSINLGFSWEQASTGNFTPRKYVCKWGNGFNKPSSKKYNNSFGCRY